MKGVRRRSPPARPRFATPACTAVLAVMLSVSPAKVFASAPGDGQPPDLMDGTIVTTPVFSANSQKPGMSDRGFAQMREEAARLERRDEAAERELASPAAVAERQRSRTANDNLDDAEAAQLLRAQFSDLLASPVPDARSLIGDDRLLAFDGDAVMRIDGQDGRPDRLVDSQVPLRAVDPDSGGAVQPTDLDLVPSGGGLEPKTGLVDVQLPLAAQDGVKVGPARVVPNGEGSLERVTAETAAYPNIGRDTDLAVTATPTGLETFWSAPR